MSISYSILEFTDFIALSGSSVDLDIPSSTPNVIIQYPSVIDIDQVGGVIRKMQIVKPERDTAADHTNNLSFSVFDFDQSPTGPAPGLLLANWRKGADKKPNAEKK